MRTISLVLILTSGVLADQRNMNNKLTPVPATQVKFKDAFWAPRLETNRNVTIWHDLRMCEETGRVENFDKAAGKTKGEFKGLVFDDSDVYKTIEAASLSLAIHPDPALEAYLDRLIARIAAAQQPDGYLNTYYTVKEPGKRWTNIKDMHEMYCAGHLFEAAVAHHRATGKRNLLDIATKVADHIDSVFGPAPGKKQEPCGHEEIELALVKLSEATGEQRYLNLAKFFIDVRGRSETHKLFGPYHQDHMPLVDQREPVGHAVRAMYFFCAATDLAAKAQQTQYVEPLDALWTRMVERKMYLTGGVGSRHSGEAFGDDYELPNGSAYNETCASIGNALWNHRMNLLHGDAKYFDVVERVLYNGFLSGISLNGDRFFYVNPLASRGKHHRVEWFGCACCPPNVARLFPQIPGMVYATSAGGDAVYVNLYAASEAVVEVGGQKVKLQQETKYTWDGKVKLSVDPEKAGEFAVKLRIPEWCKKVTGVGSAKAQAGYVEVRRAWKSGDSIEFKLDMPIERVKADSKVKADVGRVALVRGPVVYCAEAVDNGGRVFNLALPGDSKLASEHRADLLGGVTVIKGKALAKGREGEPVAAVDFTAIPYYAWDHRAPGEMTVWLNEP